MKYILPLLVILPICAVISGCRPNPQPPPDSSSSSVLNAEELARLLDFHVWKLSIPASEVYSGAQLVIVKPDGNIVRLFGTGHEMPQAHWTNILLGLRFEQGRAVGQLVAQDANPETWRVDFTNACLEDVRSWTSGQLQWKGSRVPLVHLRTTDSSVGVDPTDNILAIELVKAPSP